MSVSNCTASLEFSQHIVTNFIMLGSGRFHQMSHAGIQGEARSQRTRIATEATACISRSSTQELISIGQSVNLVRDSDFAAMKQ